MSKNIYQNIINEFVDNGCTLLRFPKNKGDDIDIFCNDLEKAERIINKMGFIITNKQKNFIECVKFINKELIIIEVANTLLHGSRFRKVLLKEHYVKQYIVDPEKNNIWLKSIRYLLSLRTDDKAKNFFVKNKNFLEENNYFLDYLNINPFSCIDIELLLSNKKKFIFKCIKWIYQIELIKEKINYHFNNLLKKKKLAIVGVDGAGKSTIIKHMTQYNIKSVYMGFKHFKFEKFYKKIMGKNLFFTFFVHFCVYIENWLRYIKSYKYNVEGFHVLFDRYPKVEYQLGNKKTKMIYYLLYKLFFPNIKTILIYVEPYEILKRKNELTIDVIKRQQEILKRNSYYIIDNTGNLDETLNNLLRKVYE